MTAPAQIDPAAAERALSLDEHEIWEAPDERRREEQRAVGSAVGDAYFDAALRENERDALSEEAGGEASAPAPPCARAGSGA